MVLFISAYIVKLLYGFLVDFNPYYNDLHNPYNNNVFFLVVFSFPYGFCDSQHTHHYYIHLHTCIHNHHRYVYHNHLYTGVL